MWRDFWQFIRTNKKWWLIPLFATLLVLAALVALTAVVPSLAPLLYPL